MLATPHPISARRNYVVREVLHIEKFILNSPLEFQVYETDDFFFIYYRTFDKKRQPFRSISWGLGHLALLI